MSPESQHPILSETEAEAIREFIQQLRRQITDEEELRRQRLDTAEARLAAWLERRKAGAV
jgi:hypothetical protein